MSLFWCNRCRALARPRWSTGSQVSRPVQSFPVSRQSQRVWGGRILVHRLLHQSRRPARECSSHAPLCHATGQCKRLSATASPGCTVGVVLRGCLKSLHGFLQRYPHAMVIVDFRELRTIVTSSEAALHQLKTLMSGLFKQPLR